MFKSITKINQKLTFFVTVRYLQIYFSLFHFSFVLIFRLLAFIMRNFIFNCFLNVSERNNYRLNFDIMLLGVCACISLSGGGGGKVSKMWAFSSSAKTALDILTKFSK